MSAASTLYSGPSTLLRPHPEVVRAFIDYWFEFAHGSVEIAWRDPQTKKVNRAEHFDIRDPALERFACDVNSIPGQDTYFTPSIVNNIKGRAEDANFVCSPGFWVDQDELAHINYANSLQHEFKPTSYVFTGRTPDPRRQMWFRLDQPTDDPALVRESNSRLVNLYKGDPSVVNPSRLMRLPGTLAWPWKPGRTPELVSWEHPVDGRARSHSLALAASLPEIPKPELIEQRGGAVTVGDLIDKIKAGNNWHTSMVQLVGHWLGRGMSDREIMVWAPELTLEGYDLDETIEEMQRAIDDGRNKWKVVNEDRAATTKLQEAQAAFGAVALPTQHDDSLFELLSMEVLSERHGKIPDMMIDGYLTRGSTTMVTGLPGTGKSPMAQHMVVCIALGVPWAGMVTQQGYSIYIAAESHAQTAMNLASLTVQELERLWECSGIVTTEQATQFVGDHILTLTSGFLIETDTPKLIKTIENEIAPGGRWEGKAGPDLLVFDTLRAMSAGSVNDDADMVAVQSQISAIKRRFDKMCGLLLNHSPKGDPEGSLGSNRLDALSEIIINITHKKPHAQADDDLILKRAQQVAGDGCMISPIAITVQRNKTWTVAKPLRASLIIKGSEMRMAYGAESMAIERPLEGEYVETPFKKGKDRPIKIPDEMKKASNSAVDKRDWAVKVLATLNHVITSEELARIAFNIDSFLFMSQSSTELMGQMLATLAEEGAIDRQGVGRATTYSRKGLLNG